MANIIEKGFDGFNIILKRTDFLKSSKNFVEWVNDKKIKGNGKLGNPYIIDSSIELPKELLLSNLDVFILIESIEFDNLDLKKCKKIVIKNCTFNKLTFAKCFNLTIINSDINVLNILRSKDIEFKNVKILKLFDFYSKGIKYFKCEITSNYFNNKKIVQNPRRLYLIIPLIVLIVILTNLTIFYSPDLKNIETIIIINGILFLSLILIYPIINRPILDQKPKTKKKKN